MFFRKWKEIDFGNIPKQHFPHKVEKKRKNGKNNGRGEALSSSGKKISVREVHHVWPKPFRNRNNGDMCQKNNIKNVNPEEHDIWNKVAGEVHPEIAFKRIIGLCTGKIKATEEEKGHLVILAGFDWQKNPDAAIVAIFDKFMPDELGEMIVPYLE